jgi:hypothetical protein
MLKLWRKHKRGMDSANIKFQYLIQNLYQKI